ncbi:acetyl-CoA synthetase-like protein [Mycena sp. CBHHK59/15]|nr:acetyl-CoA synthetase-like protein [Mycena sp. CBHHK59/15]
MIHRCSQNPGNRTDRISIYSLTSAPTACVVPMSSTTSTPAFMLIPDLVTLNSEKNPSGPFYVYADPGSSEIVTITNLEFARATHRAANILAQSGAGSDNKVAAVLALSDTVVYQATLAGLMTANFVPFPISPRNSVPGLFQLLRASSCHRVIATCFTLGPLLAGLKKHVAEVAPDFVLNIEEIPSLAQLYPNLGAETANVSFQPYETEHSRPSLDEVGLYIHSSGSTGFPRAIAHTQRTIMQWFTLPVVAETRALKLEKPIASMALPSFHLLGIFCQLLQPLCGICSAVYPPTATSSSTLPIFPSPDNILEHTRKTKSGWLVAVPALLAVWLTSPTALAYLKTLDTIVWSGGPLPQRIGDGLVDAGVNLLCGYGCTEASVISTVIQYEGDAKEWAWFRIADMVKVRWVPQGDGTFECQVLTSETHLPSVENLPDVRGYATSDLCINHPHKKHLWKIVGRVDDTIIHTSGEKTVPAPMEDIIASSPHVAAAVVFGSERPQTGTLIEVAPSLQIDVRNPVQLAELRNKIWPMIEEANAIAPAFSRIFKEMILFTSPDKPLPRSGKGTVQRKAAIALYTPEIQAIYGTVEDQISTIDSIQPPTAWNAVPVQKWILDLAARLCNVPTMSPTADLFQQGFDSLTATVLRLRVMRALRSTKDVAHERAANAISQNLAYSHPTISQLSTYLAELVAGTVTDGADVRRQMEDLIAKYSPAPQSLPTAITPSRRAPAVVLLTGSTGNLGSQLLASLLDNDKMVKIYALNRPSGSPGRSLAERHTEIFNEKGLDTSLITSPKVVFVEGQTHLSNLGLTPELYKEIANSVTLIIHNAWTLDFNMALSSFEPHIIGTCHLIDLALSSPRHPKFLFTSSIASAQSWDASSGPCPEEIIDDSNVAIGGYGQSKYIAERILANSGLNATSVRIGQICGAPPRGTWATSDWVPILVKTSISLGCLPLADGLVSWVDFETVAQAMLDVAFSRDQNHILNLVHPRPMSWNFVMRSMRDLLSKDNGSKDLRLVEFSKWYRELEICEARAGYNKENFPGLKLLEFFRHLTNSSVGSGGTEFGGVNFSVNKMQALSSALKDVHSITEETVAAWVGYWHASGFI